MTQAQLDLGPHNLRQPTAVVTIGISGSGKTTWAEEEAIKTDAKIICRDDIRRSLFNFGKWSDYKFTKAKEKQVTEVFYQLVYDSSIVGQNIIIADTNLNPCFRVKLMSKLFEYGFNVEVKQFPIDYEEAVKRDLGRLYSVGSQVIYRQYKQWLTFIGRKTYKADKGLPMAVLVDIDGTLARKSPERGFFDWDKVGLDSYREFIIDTVNGLPWGETHYDIIILSGREDVCIGETTNWLGMKGVLYDDLFMRKEGDNRKDTIIKEEIFWEHIADEYNVVAVIDDRPCMIRMWYELGIENVISVGNPWEEF